jgi:GNAT superfamily N-acetyltransferase
VTPTLRTATLDDAAAWADVVAACSPYIVQDAASTAHEMRTDGAGARRRVAVVGASVIGVSRLHAYVDEDHVSLLLMVRPDSRRHGIGRALLDDQLPVARRTGKPTLRSIVEDDDDSRAAREHWGFTTTRSFAMSMVDPRTVTAPTPPDDVAVVPLSRLGPRVVWRAHSAVVRDDPSGLSLPVSFAEFQDDWSDPRMRPDLGCAVLVDGEVAAFTMLGRAGDRAWSDMTGTLPGHRGRGYARLAKQHALAAAAAAGIRRAMAGNDAANAPMTAINRDLGYRTLARPTLAELSLLGPGPVTAEASARRPTSRAGPPRRPPGTGWQRPAQP